MLGMKYARVFVVAQKELIDFIRDWRTVLAMILVPLMIFPAIFIALPLFLQGEAAELSEYELTIEVQGDLSDNLTTYLLEENLQIIRANLTIEGSLSEPSIDANRINELGTPTIHAILRLQEVDSNASESWNYAILSDSTNELSWEARTLSLIHI